MGPRRSRTTFQAVKKFDAPVPVAHLLHLPNGFACLQLPAPLPRDRSPEDLLTALAAAVINSTARRHSTSELGIPLGQSPEAAAL